MFLEVVANSPMRFGMMIFVMTYLVCQIWSAKILNDYITSEKPHPQDKIGLIAIVSLIIGDSIHLLYLILSYIQNDLVLNGFTALSLLITSVFMTTYYAGVLVFTAKDFGEKKIGGIHWGLLILYGIRIIIAVLPSNNYGVDGPATATRNISNVIFSIFGALVLILLYKNADKRKNPGDALFKKAVIWGFISFLFYILHLILYPLNSAFGSLMLFKSLAYIFEIRYFAQGIILNSKSVSKDE